MTVTYNFCALLVFTITACSRFEPALCSARCGHSLQVLDNKVGEIRSSIYHSWSYRFGPSYDCWIIEGPEDEPIVLSFSQFSARCRKEWVSIKSSAGGEPVGLCGSKLPQPMEFPGGNITVMHHFLPHLFPVSSFRLTYARDTGDCPVTSFECLGGRCLPFSWRCNGQVECLGEGRGLGSDEQGCGAEAETPEPPKYGSTQTEEAKAEAYTEKNHERDSERHYLTDSESDLWALLKERQEEEEDQEQPQTHREPVVTPTPIEWPCGGHLQTFYGTFSPPAIRGPALFCVWTLDPQDSRPLRLDLQQLVLGPGDRLTVYNMEQGKGDIIKIITSSSNYKSVQVESHTGLMSMTYETLPSSEGSGFNATFHVGTYCPPWEGRCGGAAGGCYTKEQHCDGKWDCPETGKDEEGCRGCGINQFACGVAGQRAVASSHFAGRPVCYPVTERCNYQLYCADGSDERDCTVCQPGTFHCDSDRCVFESWRCDGQVDCKDGTDELNCTVILPRKVITAATVGSLVCGLLLVIAMGCTCKLYSLRTREYSLFAPISRQEAELIQQQAPPSYGQLIAQGIIPPVEDFPTENPNETSSLSLRGILQLLRQDAANSPHRRRRPRFIRRAVRRMRRWGLIPRPPSRPSQASSSSQQPADAAPSGQEPAHSTPTSSSSAVEAVNQPVPQKLGLLAQSEQQQQEAPPPLLPLPLPPVASPPPPPYAPPAPSPVTPQTPPVAVPPSSPSLASIFHTLGLSISLFRASPSSSSSTNSMPLSASPSFSSSSSSSDDDVLLIPLSEDTTSEDDVPMLT
ncbi:low-density lipoprotein receptor-related protein 10 [Centropristis striata]|uniref:low-density lipoprotein receptor-related protein 10 n=1 Tax=Centropristis striata TaxID=184440 RepID=UPI0027E209EA|nr:low-density lipoprotein receptor-related protein 10 [Centropristis striata]XP_059211213.1 low-density lipoprotein receptor-related protein 10 [Centropristis striata]XP_059211214.1 low-density lipoprotein receptor-related protein 10 [Centropristis striata]